MSTFVSYACNVLLLLLTTYTKEYSNEHYTDRGKANTEQFYDNITYIGLGGLFRDL
jgi:hypothetical protein